MLLKTQRIHFNILRIRSYFFSESACSPHMIQLFDFHLKGNLYTKLFGKCKLKSVHLCENKT